jgi:PAT family beta-lactamase induction signal transducer AmpG
MNEIEAVGAEIAAGTGAGEPARVEADDRPWTYGLMIAPSAVLANGVVQGGALGYLLSQHGVGSGGQSHMIFLLALPTSLYFLWSPITDFFVRRRSWLLGGGLSAAVLMGVAFQQKNLSGRMSMLLMLISACCVQLVVSSCGGMMGTMRSEMGKRKASSFYQAGSMGFGALTAWVLVWLSSRVSQGTLGWVAAGLIGLPTLAALLAPKQEEIATGTLGATARRVGGEFKATFWRVAALPYIACMLYPGASGSAIGLLPGIAHQYGVSGDSVAWINGLVGGLLVAAGSGVMALVKVRARAPVLYMVVALINCVGLFVIMLGPLRPGRIWWGCCCTCSPWGAAMRCSRRWCWSSWGIRGRAGVGGTRLLIRWGTCRCCTWRWWMGGAGISGAGAGWRGLRGWCRGDGGAGAAGVFSDAGAAESG